MTAEQKKKTRKKTELPTHMDIGEEQLVEINSLSLDVLVAQSKRINSILESVPLLERQRRAIRKAIIQKA